MRLLTKKGLLERLFVKEQLKGVYIFYENLWGDRVVKNLADFINAVFNACVEPLEKIKNSYLATIQSHGRLIERLLGELDKRDIQSRYDGMNIKTAIKTLEEERGGVEKLENQRFDQKLRADNLRVLLDSARAQITVLKERTVPQIEKLKKELAEVYRVLGGAVIERETLKEKLHKLSFPIEKPILPDNKGVTDEDFTEWQAGLSKWRETGKKQGFIVFNKMVPIDYKPGSDEK